MKSFLVIVTVVCSLSGFLCLPHGESCKFLVKKPFSTRKKVKSCLGVRISRVNHRLKAKRKWKQKLWREKEKWKKKRRLEKCKLI